MEIAVAANSPLGQYLAELKADSAGASAAQLLDTRTPHTKRPRRQVAQISRRSSRNQLFASLIRRVQLLVVRRLITKLCDFHPTIREELQQEIDRSDTEVLNVVWGKTQGQLESRVVLLELQGVGNGDEIRVFMTVATVMVAMTISGGESWNVFVLDLMMWIIAVAAFLLLGLELTVRLLFAWHAHRINRLVISLKEFANALESLNQVFGDSLTLVKRAELASRGYRLGTGLLPPIGRLEASNAENHMNDGSGDSAAEVSAKKQLRCLPLRQRLRKLNDELRERASSFENDDTNLNMSFQDSKVNSVDEQAPSLLLTALSKQRNRAVYLLESAVHTVLVRNVARACSSRSDAKNLFTWVGSQHSKVNILVDSLSRWTEELKMWNTTSDPMSLLTSVSDTKSSERQQLAPSDTDHPHLKTVSTHLQELRSTSETLNALVISAQYEFLPADSMVERLLSSREAMKSMIQQLQEAWRDYDNVLDALTVGEENSIHSDLGEVENDNEKVQPSSRTLPSASVPTTEEPDCTVVFTGTSTGDDGFDLQALLNQQDLDAATSAASPHFVRELRDVLAHRQAQAEPGRTKQVDHDRPIFLSVPPKTVNEAPPSPPANSIFALPRGPPRTRSRRELPVSCGSNESLKPIATTFTMELQALLQHVPPTQQNDVEYLGDSDEEDVDELQPKPKLN